MSGSRVVYQNWIVEMGFDPAQPRPRANREDHLLKWVSLDDPSGPEISDEEARPGAGKQESSQEIKTRVHRALEQLTLQEREFITQFHFIGKTYREISEQSGRPIHKLEALHKRAIRKLKKALSSFVRERFNLDGEPDAGCPICRSPHAAQIDRLIAERDKTATWKPVIKILHEKYGLKVRSPQMLIGHEKYHGRNQTGRT